MNIKVLHTRQPSHWGWVQCHDWDRRDASRNDVMHVCLVTSGHSPDTQITHMATSSSTANAVKWRRLFPFLDGITHNERKCDLLLLMCVCMSLLHPWSGNRVFWWSRLSVCLSACKHLWKYNTCLIFTKFLCMLPMAMARSSSGGIAICCVLLVLRMTAYLRISQGSSTLPSSWRKHSPHAALDLAMNGEQEYPLRDNGLTLTGLLFRCRGLSLLGCSRRVEYWWNRICA